MTVLDPHSRSDTFDHGAALRVPADQDAGGWGRLVLWIGEAGRRLEGGAMEVETACGPVVAFPGDWIVLSVSGRYHVARTETARWHA